MTPARASLLISVLLAGAAGCRKPHLGPDTRTAYDAALAAQRQSAPARTPTFSADDARRSAAARDGDGGDAPAGAGTPGALVVPMPSPTAAAGAAWPGATGNISLEAR